MTSLLPLSFLQLNFREEALEVKVKLMQEVVRTIRSMRQDYLPPKVKPEGMSSCYQTRRFQVYQVIFDAHPPSDIISRDGSFRPFLCPSMCMSVSAVYVVCKTDEASTTLREFVDVTTTLSQCSK